MDLIRPFTMVVSGQSGCGKTVWVAKLIKSMKDKFDKVIFAYTMHQPIYDTLGVDLVEGFPTDVPSNTLLVIDDMMLQCSKEMAALFTKMRHASISTIFIVQNLFFDNRYMRTISRNAHYMVLFPNPRDATMVSTLSYQMYPAKPKWITNAFEDATKIPFGYLFLDLKPNVKHRVKTGVLENEEPIVYLHEGEFNNISISDHTRSLCQRDTEGSSTESNVSFT